MIFSLFLFTFGRFALVHDDNTRSLRSSPTLRRHSIELFNFFDRFNEKMLRLANASLARNLPLEHLNTRTKERTKRAGQ